MEFVNKMVSKIKGADARIKAWDAYTAGATIYIIVSSVPLQNGIGIEPVRLNRREIRSQGGYDGKTFGDFCQMYKESLFRSPTPKKVSNVSLDYYEEWHA